MFCKVEFRKYKRNENIPLGGQFQKTDENSKIHNNVRNE